MTDTRELVDRLKVVARCGTDSTMRHSAYAFMAQDPGGDYVTYSAYVALSEQRRVLEEALQFYADISKYPAPLTGGCGDLYFDCGQVARAALTSGGLG